MSSRARAIVTGGSRGIGLAAALALARASFDVTVTGRDRAKLDAAASAIAAHGVNAEALELDAADLSGTFTALESGAYDVLVANVGQGFSATIQTTSLEDWETVLRTNTSSAFAAMKAVIPRMVANGWGRVVTVGSMSSHVPIRHGVAYTASKHALLGLTRAVALDLRGTGVTVNMVAPAFVRTDMTEANARIIAEATGSSVADAERRLAAFSDENRLLEPDEIAAEVMRFVEGDMTGESTAMGFHIG